ncbi:DUF1835 domain-containing protein [Halobacillus litoralis]|uniref:DUF1835 domain-containing protein n=1 Tax=Halobacillus litoralis TaxID=45668 RepID=UPI001CD2AA8B|nr:DUF1835 domain-containing protein [Halobacillus litoralis]MCA0971990.1 DUF1835 domain-containing protein [Halobacillus litoralis]
MIHIVNGDAVGERLSVEGEVIVWCEMYDWGPLNHEWHHNDLIGRRAAFFEEALELPSPLFIQTSKEQLHALHNIPPEEEVVLWFEHDRYDQTMLMFLIHELSKRALNLSMVTLDAHPSADPFYGMGQLDDDHLNDLIKTKQTVTPEQVEEAVRGWRAYASPSVKGVEKWVRESPHPLPYLKEAMNAHLDYFPDRDTGVNRVEKDVLSFLNGNIRTFKEVHQFLRENRIRDGISDLYASHILRQIDLLLERDGPLPNFNTPERNPEITLSQLGQRVLQGEVSRIAACGIDTWVGGVRLFSKKRDIKENAYVDQ